MDVVGGQKATVIVEHLSYYDVVENFGHLMNLVQ